MGILKYENLFSDDHSALVASTPVPPIATFSTRTSAAIVTTQQAISASGHQVDLTERLIEAGVSILVCFVLFLLQRLCQWLLDKCKSCTTPSDAPTAIQNLMSKIKASKTKQAKQTKLIHL
jgi:hypothetical protein